MGKAEEERLAITVEKYQFLVDKVISAFHNKTEKKNVWEKVKKDLGFEPDEAAKSDFTSLQTKYLRRKKTLKDSNSWKKKVIKAEMDMREYLLSWLGNFVYKRNKCNFQNSKEDMEASEPVVQYNSEIDPDIFDEVDIQNRSSFIEHILLSLEP